MMSLTAMFVMISATFISSCSEKDNEQGEFDNVSITMNLNLPDGKMVLKPFIKWGGSVSEVKNYMKTACPEWEMEGSLYLSGTVWVTDYCYNEDISMCYSFTEEGGNNLIYSTIYFDGSSDFKPAKDEAERLGFKYKGEITYDIENVPLVNLLYLSADEKLELQIAGWEGESPYWGISLQATDPEDLLLVK